MVSLRGHLVFPYTLLFAGIFAGILVLSGVTGSILMLGALGGVLPAFGLARLLARRILHPLDRLLHVADQIAAGEQPPPLLATRHREIEQLSRAFNRALAGWQSRNESLVEEQRQLEAVLTATSDGLVMVNRRGEVQRLNRAAAQLLEVSRERAEGLSVAELLRHHRLIELWEECRHSGSAVSTALEQSRRGVNLFWQVSITPFALADSSKYLILIQDLTEIHRLQTVRRDFVSNISHELRTPLASLKALVDTLKNGAMEEPEVAARFLDRAEVEVDAMAQMVEELQELARIESGQVPLQLAQVPVSELILPVVDRLQPQAERGQLSLALDLPAGLPLVLADAARVRQVVTNLTHNAIKFTPVGGTIVLCAVRQQDMVVISIQDSGVGIPAADVPRIFERFFKADRARTGGGTGLGLAICRHLVEAHGGRIWVKSRERKGSSFYFSLPVA